MSNYYFATTVLPTLKIGISPEINFQSFEELLKTNLSQRDLNKVKTLRRYSDIQNIQALWLGEKLEPYGNFTDIELEEALENRQGLPEYVYNFIESHESLKDRLYYFPQLLIAFFKNEEKEAAGFLKTFLNFEHEWRLVLTGFRSKQLGRDLFQELQFEDPFNDLVAQILAQKDAKTYIPPIQYQELQTLFEQHAQEPLELHRALYEYRFNKIEQLLGVDLFSIDRILGYLVQLIMVEKWQQLDIKKGIQVMDSVLVMSVNKANS